MMNRIGRLSAGALALSLAAAMSAAPALAQRPALYDVSYRWSANLPNIVAYKREVVHVLGRHFSGRLAVVKWQSNYGLVYNRRGYFNSASKTARRHSHILTRHGLYPAKPIVAQKWTPVFASRARSRPPSLAPPAPILPPQNIAAAPPELSAGNTKLGGEIASYIETLRSRGAIKRDERTAWSIYDLTSNTQLVSINEDVPFETASMVKPFIALAYFTEVSQGRKRYGAFARERMEAMIQDSDNMATDYFLRKMGGPSAVQRLLKKDYGGILRDLHLVEYIPYSGRTYRNKASAHDYNRFLYALWKRQLPDSDELMRLMSLPKRNRLYTGVDMLPRNTEVFDKTGTTSRLCGDMGILVVDHAGRDYPYIVVGIIQKSRKARPYFEWMIRRGDVIRQVSNIAYGAIARIHGFDSETAAAPAPPKAAAIPQKVAAK